ncbi:MAG: extracellular solute-binding protein [Oscillospiraceae bacterium]|jgi:putative aldouronate transport system substrate-binding protein|nr:extracellular solute-binding protein [Oscillospiraceae bacterium]
MKKWLTCLLACMIIAALAAPAMAAHPMRYVTPGNYMTDMDTALSAVNQKLADDGVDIEVSFIRIPWDAYNEKLNVMLATGEPFELLHIMQDVKNLTTIASMDAIIPIDEYLPSYPVLTGMFNDEDWTAGTYKGQVYAVPANWKDFTRLYGYMFARGDVMEKYLDGKYPETAEDLLGAFAALQPAVEEETGVKPYMWLHNIRHAPAFLHRTYDTWPFYVEMSQGFALIRQDGTVESYYESEEFKKDAEFFAELYSKGYIHPDILSIAQEYKSDMANIGSVLPSPTFNHQNDVGVQKNIPESYFQFYMLAPEKIKLVYTLAQNLNAISATAEDPESGLKFLSWLYADKANHDLFHWGIEGVHYTASDPYRYKYIEGDDGNALYNFDTWMTGFKGYMRYDESYPDAGIEYDQVPLPNDEIVYTPAAAFLFDATELSMELANMETELISSMYPIRFGLVSYEEGFDSAIAKLKAAGLDTYIAEFQRQFAEYLAEQ